jgi:hypothetical protein
VSGGWVVYMIEDKLNKKYFNPSKYEKYRQRGVYRQTITLFISKKFLRIQPQVIFTTRVSDISNNLTK